jgi:hypothetical protein
MKAHSLILTLAATLGLAGAATAAGSANSSPGTCFFARSWEGWKAPNDKTLYLRVNHQDVYRVDLQVGSSFLTGPDPHLINDVKGPDTICTPLDLDLRVSPGSGEPAEPLFVKSLVKLTPQQVAAIPKKDLP